MSHIFISYSHKDSGYAHQLADALHSRGVEVWIDERLDYGSQWPHEIQKQLDSCGAFIVVMSPRSFESEWVQSELQRAKRKQKPIFPLLLEGDEPWLSVESTQYQDVRGGILPDERFFSTLERILEVTPVTPAPGTPVRKGGAANPKVGIGIAVGLLVIALVTIAVFVLRPLFGPGSDSKNGLGAVEASPAPEAEEFDDAYGVSMRLVPQGEFMMGIDANAALEECLNFDGKCQLDWFTDEQPVRQVYLDAFYIDTFEVTNALYSACVKAGVCYEPTRTDSNTRPDYFYNAEFSNYPVIHVDWDMAQTYCGWRGAQLPSEAQWEKAARGTDGRLYPWGDKIDPKLANYSAFGAEDTIEAGDFDAGKSPYGLYDMAGNVWEWVNDWYDDSYYQFAPLSNPPGPDSGQFHVLRGGSWYDTGYLLRTSLRGRDDPTFIVDNGFGFRCVRPMP